MQTSSAGLQWSRPQVPSLIDLQVNQHSAGQIATITVRNPARRNAMTRAMWRALREVIEAVNSSQNNSCLSSISLGYSQIRCLIIAGQAGHFCAGGDISEYPEFRFTSDGLHNFHEQDVAPALHALLACDIPMVAQIEGNCMGGGLEIAACCDIRIAGQGASFGAPIAKLGMPMAPQELAIVLRAAGEATVREMLLEARTFNALQMQERGFVQRVVADTDVAQEALTTAQRIAALSPQAARLNKQALRHFYMQKQPVTQAKPAQAAMKNIVPDRAADNPFAYADSAEHIEGITAFLQKRSPQF
jgi:enoyl-CoA hydratase